MEQIRIQRRRVVRRAEEVIEPIPVEPAVRTDDAAELIERIDHLLERVA